MEQMQDSFSVKVIFNNIVTQPGFKLLFFLVLAVQNCLKVDRLHQYCLSVLIEPSAAGTRTSRKWLWRKMELCCCVLHPHMVSATSRIWCKSSNGESVLTTLWRLWPVRQVRWKLFRCKCWWSSTTLLFTCSHAGCLNGGGQLKASPGQNPKELLQKVEELYRAERPLLPEDNTSVAELYQSWLHSVGEERAKELLRTQYHTVEKMKNGLTMKWWPLPWVIIRQNIGAYFCTDSKTVQIQAIVFSDGGLQVCQ